MPEAIITDRGLQKRFTLHPQHFKTGNKGYHGGGRMEFGGRIYQVTILLVDVTTKLRKAQAELLLEDFYNLLAEIEEELKYYA
jgi:hypothetical protein